MRTEANRAETRRVLHEWWGIEKRGDLLGSLSRLERTGHRAEFQKWAHEVGALSDGEFRTLIQAQREPYRAGLMKRAREHYRSHRDRSLVAWDYGRYIMLCRWGYMVGFLTEDEAWKRIMPAARIIQKSFTSWNDFGNDYLLGRSFWSRQQTERNGRVYADIERWLLRERQSPWRRLPWGMNLGT